MQTLMQASNQWARRPSDERFTSLDAMASHFSDVRARSHELVIPTARMEAIPTGMNELVIDVDGEYAAAPTHHVFGQLATLGKAPAEYLRTLPAPLAADNINYGLKFKREREDVGLLIDRKDPTLRAATGPRYGRIWNEEVVNAIRDRFGDGITGDFRVPGEFGKRVEVTTDNTTLYASDRDMFVFLADEENRIEVPNRRGGKSGSLARGFFVWNSEVGDKTLGFGQFLFDYVCQNRIVWGAEQYAEVKVRHTSGAPERFLQEVKPVLLAYANASAAPLQETIAEAQKQREAAELEKFLGERFGTKMVQRFKAVHENEEGRPIESLWDATTAVTAYARGLEHQNERVELERKGGELLRLAA